MPRPGKPLAFEDGPDRDRVLNRFYSFVAADGPDSCWEWLGFLGPLGYGTTTLPVVGRTGAHRVAYALFKGPIEDDSLTIDHLCRIRHCVNPDHLELVSHTENMRRVRHEVLGKMCHAGHEFVPMGEGAMRRCRQCFNDYKRGYLREYRARKRREAQDAA